MADNDFRSYRSRDPADRDLGPAREDAGDPLAELARLIGQSDPYGEAARHDRQGLAQPGEETALGLDWSAEDDYAEQRNRADGRYVPPPVDTYAPDVPQERGYEDEPAPGGRYFSGPAARFNGFRGGDEETAEDARRRAAEAPVLRSERQPSFTPRGAEDFQATDQPDDDAGHAYAAEDYYDEAPSSRRRGGLVVVMAVLGLAVLGTAGAFGYRAMFGGSVLPALPPIIKPASGPNKIMPSHGDSQAGISSQGSLPGVGSGEKLVSHEERPVDIQEPPKAEPRIVSTIPIVPGQNAASPGVAEAAAPNAPAAPWPPAPSPAVSAPPPQMAAPVAPAAPPPAPVSAQPRKIHTVTIRADQGGGSDTAAPPAAAPTRITPHPAAPAPRPTRAAALSTGANEPLSIVPAQAGGPAATRTRTAVARASAPRATAVSSSRGGYAVQVTSQRSEADAEASFRALRAKCAAA